METKRSARPVWIERTVTRLQRLTRSLTNLLKRRSIESHPDNLAAIRFRTEFTPDPDVDYGWIAAYADKHFDQLNSAFRYVDEKAESLVRYSGGGTGLVALGAIVTVTPQNAAVVVSAAPSLWLALVTTGLAMWPRGPGLNLRCYVRAFNRSLLLQRLLNISIYTDKIKVKPPGIGPKRPASSGPASQRCALFGNLRTAEPNFPRCAKRPFAQKSGEFCKPSRHNSLRKRIGRPLLCAFCARLDSFDFRGHEPWAAWRCQLGRRIVSE